MTGEWTGVRPTDKSGRGGRWEMAMLHIGALIRLLQRIAECPSARPRPANDIRWALAVVGVLLCLAVVVREVWEVWRWAGR